MTKNELSVMPLAIRTNQGRSSMSVLARYRANAATIAAATAAVAVAGLLFANPAQTEDLKSYDSSTKNFWLHPPDDWFMGD